MLLIYSEPGHWQAQPAETRAAVYEEFFALTRELRERGALVSSHELQPVATAITVRVEDGQPITTDGPFAETKEALGGYYLIDVDSQDEAIEWAARIPSAKHGHGRVEVRPVVVRNAEIVGEVA